MELMATCFRSSGYCAHEMSIFESIEQAGEVYFSKQPNDIKQLQHIFERDEKLHVIYMGRDPRAVITSKHKEAPNQYFCNYRVWSECDRASQCYLKHPRFLQLRYEDLVDNPDSVQSTIKAQFDFLNYQYPFSEYQKFAEPSEAASTAMNGLRKVNKSSLDKWREHLPHLAQQYTWHPRLAEDLIRLGYEPDKAWLGDLEGVEPRIYPCRYPQKRQYLKEWEKDLRVYLKSRRYLKARNL
ncbi:MAG: hypothetical protein ACI9DH_000949 [Halioglobus sp.]|jgi:hypothetical protein